MQWQSVQPERRAGWTSACRDIEAAKTFYAGLLGWECRTDPRPEAGGYTMCFVDGVVAAAITPMWAEHATAGWSVYFASDDADVSAAAVAGNGGQVIAPPMDVFDAGRMAFALDPVGATFGIWQKGVHRGMETDYVPGAVAWIELVARRRGRQRLLRGGVRPEGRAVPGMPDSYWLLQQGGETAAGLIELDEERSGAEGSHWRVYVAVADIDATLDGRSRSAVASSADLRGRRRSAGSRSSATRSTCARRHPAGAGAG